MPESKPRLSVCMILENDAAQLSTALDSIKNIADEIIIVNTLQTNGGAASAHAYGAKVYEHPWQNDYSLHRNQSISYASGDWILIMNADEELRSGHEALLSIMKTSSKNAVALTHITLTAQGRFESRRNELRLLRASAALRYKDPLCEELDFDADYDFTDAQIVRDNTRLKRSVAMEKLERINDMLLGQHQRDPQNPKYIYNLALNYLSWEMPGETIIAAERAIDIIEKLKAPERLKWKGIYYARAAAAVALNDLQPAEHFARKALLLDPDDMDAQAVLSAVYYKQKDSPLLRSVADRFMELHEGYRRDPASAGLLPLYTFNQAAYVLMRVAVDIWRCGPPEEASAWYQKALDSCSDFSRAVLVMYESLWREGMYTQALHVLEVAVERSDYERSLMDALVEAFARLHRSGDASAALQRMEQAGKSGPALFELRARQAMLSGDFKTARDLYNRVLESEPQNFAARVRMGLACEGLGDSASAEKLYLEALEISDDPSEIAVHLARLYSRMERYESAQLHLEPLLQKSVRRFDGLLMLARIYINLGLVDKLMELTWRLTVMLNIQLKSDTVDSAADLAVILSEAARRLEYIEEILAAEEAHVLACQLVPEVIQHQLNYARFLVRFGRVRDAVNLVENLLRHHPDQREAFVVLAECYEAMGAYDAAQMARKRADEMLNMN